MPQISVIVPVYKVEAYLDRCVQSILCQTYTDFELILVDDGSPDNCGAMCDAWAEKDSRIKVIHKENGGLSDARNAGIDIARGQYLSFVDSDDYIHPRMLEALYGAVRDHGVKVSICGYLETEGEPLPEPSDLKATIWEPREYYLERCVNATVAWGKLYAAECFATLRYPKGKIHEDEFLTYRILFEHPSVAVVDCPLYGYFRNSAGITKSGWNAKRLHALEAIAEQCAYFRKKGDREIFAKRAWAYMKITDSNLRSIAGQKNAEAFSQQKKWLLKNGRRMLRRCRSWNVFDTEKDGWLIVRFFPGKMWAHSFMKAVRSKLHGKGK